MRADLFRIGRLTFRAEWAFFPVAALLVYRGRTSLEVIQWLVAVGAAVAMFEHGHSLALRRARLERSHPNALGGTLATLLLLGVPASLLVMAGVLDASPGLRSMMTDVAFVGVMWSLFTMLPVPPLDGGRALAGVTGPRAACEFGIIVSLSGALISAWTGLVSLAVVLGVLGGWNLLAVLALARRSSATVDDSDRRPPPTRRAQRGSRPASHMMHPCSSEAMPTVFPMAERQVSAAGMIERRAWNALRAGDLDGAARCIARAPEPLVLCPFLGASLAAATGDPAGVPAMVDAMLGPFDPPNLVVARVVAEAGIAAVVAATLLDVPDQGGSEAVATLQSHLMASDCGWAAAEVAEVRLLHGPVTAPEAFEAACCWAAVGNPERALAKLAVAVTAGMTSAELIDNTVVLAPVRRLAAFSLLRERLA